MAGTTKTITKNMTFRQAGFFKLQKFDKNGILDPNKIYLSSHQTVKSIKRATTPTTAELPDGNSDYPAHIYVTKSDTSITIGLSTHDPELEAFVNDEALVENTTNGFVEAIDVTTIPDSATYVLPKKVTDENVRIFMKDKLGNVFTPTTEATPAAGQYKIAVATNVATITFADADKGKEVHINFDAKHDVVAEMSYSAKSKLVPMQITIIGGSIAFDETEEFVDNIIVDQAILDKFTPPDKSNDPTGGCEISFKTIKPRAGKKPVVIKYAK